MFSGAVDDFGELPRDFLLKILIHVTKLVDWPVGMRKKTNKKTSSHTETEEKVFFFCMFPRDPITF